MPIRLSLLIGVPLLIAGAFGLSGSGLAPTAIPERTVAVERAFQELAAEAAAIAAGALEAPALTSFRPDDDSALAPRLEGLGVLDRELRFLEWTGRPWEPPPDFLPADGPEWWVRLGGARTRLLARAGPDAQGRFALASFVLASPVDGLGFLELLPAELRRGVVLDIEFVDSGTSVPRLEGERTAGPVGEPPATAVARLEAPSGKPLGEARLTLIEPRYLAAQRWALGLAWAAVAATALVGLLLPWARWCRHPAGYLAAVVVVLCGRWLLSASDAPARLLSRSLGEASLFGSTVAWGWIASPADLLLTGLAAYLLARATARFAAAWSEPRPRATACLVVAGALLATLLAVALTLPLARDARAPLLERHTPLQGDARATLLVGLVLVVVGAAELWGASWWRILARNAPSVRAGRLPAVVSLLALATTVSLLLQGHAQRLALERLRDEYAPLTLEQSSRRALALAEAVQHVNDSYGDHRHPMGPADAHPEYLAYRFWVSSGLFNGGYKSSLDFYNANGDRVSHFAFDLPTLDEQTDPARAPSRLQVVEETYELGAVEQRLLHAEIAVTRGGELLGVVVGHVLDEPENLPFLPGSRPYLEALGAGLPLTPEGLTGGVPQYVLYDPFGAVRLSTLSAPPAQTAALRLAGERHAVVRVHAGEADYVGLALADDDRLHLLLAPHIDWLSRLAAAARVCLLAVVLLAITSLLPPLLRGEPLRALTRRLRRSFYRKLLTALLLAAIVPLVGLGLILRGYVERRGASELEETAIRHVTVAQRVLEDYLATREADGSEPPLDDAILHWLRRLVGQEITVYRDGLLQASTKRELFESGLLAPRLNGEVRRRLVGEGLPYLVRRAGIGPRTLPVAYAPLRGSQTRAARIVAVPIVLEQRQIAGAVDRIADVILLASALLMAMLALTAAFLARTVARPVRELVVATTKIAHGDYETRLRPRTEDEVAELVSGFNSMASALSQQRSDLEHRREYIERLLRHATTGVLSTDATGRLLTVNPAALELLAAVERELHVGSDLLQALASAVELRPLVDALERAPRNTPTEVDLESEGKPRRLRFVRINLREPSGRLSGRLILLDDVTELMRSNQLAAWAEMARAIAHEIKNPLTPIQLSTEHLKLLLADRGVLPAPEIEACLDTVIKQVRSLHEIAGEFSAYARLPDLAPRRVDPADLVREVVAPYRAAPPAGVTIEERYAPTDPVSADTKVLARALVNLIENALQAMPDGGALRLSVAPGADPGEVVLAVADTGTGLAPEVRRRLFEPYFSTKSSGTGLGLAIVRRAVEAHRGRIEVTSELQRGTTVRIVLPVSRPDPAPAILPA